MSLPLKDRVLFLWSSLPDCGTIDACSDSTCSSFSPLSTMKHFPFQTIVKGESSHSKTSKFMRRKRDLSFPGIWVGLFKPRCIVGFTGIFNMAAKRDKVNKIKYENFLSVQSLLSALKECLLCYSKQLLTGNQSRENRCKYSNTKFLSSVLVLISELLS